MLPRWLFTPLPAGIPEGQPELLQLLSTLQIISGRLTAAAYPSAVQPSSAAGGGHLSKDRGSGFRGPRGGNDAGNDEARAGDLLPLQVLLQQEPRQAQVEEHDRLLQQRQNDACDPSGRTQDVKVSVRGLSRSARS